MKVILHGMSVNLRPPSKITATNSHVYPYRNKRPTSRTAYFFVTVSFGRKSIAFVRQYRLLHFEREIANRNLKSNSVSN
jgi:hypothetical protein